MRKTNIIIGTLASFIITLVATTAQAQIQRTFVSTSGTDAGNCNPTAPCRSFGYALTQTLPNGEIIALTSGGYGPVTINKAVQITAPTGVYVAITQNGAGNAITVNAGASDVVVIRGLTLNGLNNATNGIDFNSGAALHIENCVINGFSSNGILFDAAGELFIKDTIVRNTGGNGIFVNPPSGTAKVSIDRSLFENNSSSGIAIQDNGEVTASHVIATGNGSSGFAVSDNTSRLTVSNSTASDNVGSGFNAISGSEVSIESCVARGNGTGMRAFGVNTIMRVSNSVATDNTNGFSQLVSATFLSRQNNTVNGNTTDISGTITPLSGT